MNRDSQSVELSRDAAWRAAAAVADPEIPFVTVAELGILRDVNIIDGVAVASVTPTYSGCPAVLVIEKDIETALIQAGFTARIERCLIPAWSTDWITEQGRTKLKQAGIAPPCTNDSQSASAAITFFSRDTPCCPRCDSKNTEMIAAFGSTACKAQYRCKQCAEPFDYFKPL